MTSDTATQALVRPENERLKIFLHALLFVAGFSLVFIVGWGGSVTALGQLFGAYKQVIAQIGGVVVIIFGLATLEAIRIPWFYADTRVQYTGQRGRFGGSMLMGIFFAAGWSPCIGATLGAILTMGLSQQTVGQEVHGASPALVGMETIQSLQYSLLVFGFIGSLYTAYCIAKNNQSDGKVWRTFIPYATLIVILTIMNVYLFMLPMAMRM